MSEAVINCDRVSKVYASENGSVSALDNISIQVRRGELLALLGPSGCGKSTLLSILAGLTRASSGTVLVDGELPRPRGDVGVMFQHSLLLPWRTVLKNVLLPAELLGLPKKKSAERARELLALVGLGGSGLLT